MIFDEVRLPVEINPGSTMSVSFKTQKVIRRIGGSYRNTNVRYPVRTFDVSYLLESNATVQSLVSFHKSRRGSGRGFRYKNWFDYTSRVDGANPLSTTALDQACIQSVLDTKKFFLAKTYTDGSYTFQQRIYKPVAGTIKVSVGGVVTTSGFSVDTANGIITFVSDPGGEVKAGFEYDIPVMFSEDSGRLLDRGILRPLSADQQLTIDEVIIADDIPTLEDDAPAFPVDPPEGTDTDGDDYNPSSPCAYCPNYYRADLTHPGFSGVGPISEAGWFYSVRLTNLTPTGGHLGCAWGGVDAASDGTLIWAGMGKAMRLGTEVWLFSGSVDWPYTLFWAPMTTDGCPPLGDWISVTDPTEFGLPPFELGGGAGPNASNMILSLGERNVGESQ